MKIALLDPSLFTWPYDKALVEGLQQNGHEVVLYTKHLAPAEPGAGHDYVRELFYPGLQSAVARRLPSTLFLLAKGLAHIAGLMSLWLKLRREKPNAIHFQWTPLPVVDRWFVPLFRTIAPVILTVHDSSPFNNNPKSRLQAFGSISIMRRFDHLIVHTDAARRTLIRYGLAADRISRIDHGVLGQCVPTGLVPLQEKKADDAVVVLLFGQIKPYKGVDVLIRALQYLPDDVRSIIRVHIVGRPQMDVDPLMALARTSGVEDLIKWDLRFVGEEEIPAILAGSDITAMPYREIDASGVLMMALSTGRPIVASNIGLFAEMLVDGEHGFLVPQEDAPALGHALTRLVRSPATRTAMANNLRALSASIPDWRDIAEATSDVYLRIRP
ncbi:glycosyltransferase family 4 protein [Methylobacterium segetis]|uniref:glycosyltransferase family 4 protein n=1 Tax=Methylobacterium segetis TaxID=2488750 RepID=UPI001049370A|nr:glycosyltransferase family 4 protein [Methylobacterium segetis]